MKTVRTLTINAWFSAAVTMQAGSIWFWTFSEAKITSFDIVMALVFCAGLTFTSLAVLGTFALGIRSLFVEEVR